MLLQHRIVGKYNTFLCCTQYAERIEESFESEGGDCMAVLLLRQETEMLSLWKRSVGVLHPNGARTKKEGSRALDDGILLVHRRGTRPEHGSLLGTKCSVREDRVKVEEGNIWLARRFVVEQQIQYLKRECSKRINTCW